MEKQIKVIMIPDETRIIINYGKKDNPDLSVYQKIQVSGPGLDIIDPDSDQILGNYGPIKTILKITEIFDYYSVARDVSRKNDSIFNVNIISPLLTGNSTVTYHKIEVNDTDITKVKITDKQICIGDYVQLIYS